MPVPTGTVNHHESPTGLGYRSDGAPDSTMPTDPRVPTTIHTVGVPSDRRIEVLGAVVCTPLPLRLLGRWSTGRHPGAPDRVDRPGGSSPRRYPGAPDGPRQDPPGRALRPAVTHQLMTWSISGAPGVVEEQDEDERQEHQERLEVVVAGEAAGRDEPLEDGRPVEGRARDEVEHPEHDVGEAGVEEDLLERATGLAPVSEAGHGLPAATKHTPDQGGQDEVGQGPDQGDQHDVVAGTAQVARVDRDRLGPAVGTDPRQGQDGRHQQRAHRVDVADRVEVEPPGPLGRVVAEGQGHGTVGDLVEDDRRDQDAEVDELVAAAACGSG